MGKILGFSPQELTAHEKKKFLIGSVIPRPIALVSTISHDGIVNIAPFSYFNIVTYNPPMLSISIQRIDGKMKDTSRNILQNQEAVVQIVDTDNVENANKTSASLDSNKSELDVSEFTLVDSEAVKVPGVNETKIRFETCLYQSIIIRNEDTIPTADVLFLKIMHYHIDEAIYEDGYIDSFKLDAVSRLAGNDYAKIGKRFTVKRPT